MSGEKSTKRGESIKDIAEALGLGHLEAVLAKKPEIMALSSDELDRLATVLAATEAAGHECCTGG